MSSPHNEEGDAAEAPNYRGGSWLGDVEGGDGEPWFLDEGQANFRDCPWLGDSGAEEMWVLDEAAVPEPVYRSLKLAPAQNIMTAEMGRMAFTHIEQNAQVKREVTVDFSTKTAISGGGVPRAIPDAVLLAPCGHAYFKAKDLHAAHRAVADALSAHEDVDVVKYSASKAKWTLVVYAAGQPERAAKLRVCLFASDGLLALDVRRRKGDVAVAARAFLQLRTMLAALPGFVACDVAGSELPASALLTKDSEYCDCMQPPPLRCPLDNHKNEEPVVRAAFEPLWQMLVSPFRDVVEEGAKAMASATRDANARAVLANDLPLLRRLLELATTSSVEQGETRRCAVCALFRLWCEPAAIAHAATAAAIVNDSAIRALVDLAAGWGASEGVSLQSAEELMTRRLCAQILQRFCAHGHWAVFFDTHASAQARLKEVAESSPDARLHEIVDAAQCDMMACAH